ESGDENTCYNQWIECDWWELEGLCNDAIGIAVGILPRLASLPGEPPLYAFVVDSAVAAGFLGVVEEAKNNRDFDVSEQTEPINIAGRLRYVYALGSAKDISLREARDQAAELRGLLRRGIDPLQVKRASAIEAELVRARSITFADAAAACIAAKRPAWRNAKHAAQWTSTI